MPTTKPPKYQVRDSIHRVKGPYSEKEILHRIQKGKYSGEEEAAEAPYVEWHKLSSIPAFYDAFLNRIHHGIPPTADNPDEGAKVGSEPKSESALPDPHATHQADPFATLLGPAETEASEGLKTEVHRVPGQTVHQTDIDKLFLESGAASKTVPMKKGTQVLVDATVVKGQPVASDLLAEPLANLEPEIPAPQLNPIQKFQNSLTPEVRKRLPLYAIVAMVPILLLVFSSEDSSVGDNGKTAQAPQGNREYANQGRLSLLTREADDLYLADMPAAYEKAVRELREAIEIDSTRVDLYLKQAQALARVLMTQPENGELDKEFLTVVSRGRELEPENSAFYRAEAIRSMALGKSQEALELSYKAMESDPLGYENFLIQAECLIALERWDEADTILRGVLTSNSDLVVAQLLWARLKVRNQEWEPARRAAFRVTQLNPMAVEAYRLLGESYAGVNRLAEAKLWFETAAKLTPWSSAKPAALANWRAGNMAELTNDKESAKYYYSAAKALNPGVHPELENKVFAKVSAAELKAWQEKTYFDKEYLSNRADEQWDAKNYSESYQYYLGLHVRYPEDSGIMTRTGEAREKLAQTFDDFLAVRETYREATQADPKDYRPFLRMGMLATKQYDFDAGYADLSRAERLAPDQSEVYLELGKHFIARKDLRLAGEYLHTADQLDTTSADISYYQGLVYKSLNGDNPREALSRFQAAYTKDPQNYEALAEWMKLKVVNYEKMFAVKFLKNLQDSDPKNANLMWVLGEIYAANKEHLRAVTQYHRALDLDNRISRVRMSLGRALTSVGRLDEAVAEFQLASELDRMNGDGYFEASGILYDGKRFAEAESQIQSLLEVLPRYPGAKRRLAYIYKGLNEKEKAVAFLKEEVEANPLNYQYAIELAELHMHFQQYEDSIKALGVVTTLPLEKNVKDTRSPTGIKKIETGFRPLKIRALLLLSQSHRFLNRADVAEGAITAAVALSSDDPEIQRELGYVLHAQQRDREAATAFRAYLQLNPGAPDAMTIRDILDKTLIEE